MKDFKILSYDMEKICVLVISIVLGIFLLIPHTPVLAEQVGGSPESGVDSRLHQISDTLAASSHGSVSSGTWGDWGATWNRIYSAGIWTPSSGNAVAADVTAGKTFYSGLTRTLLAGTYSAWSSVYANFQYSARDDYGGPNGSGAEDYQGEESVWSSPAANVWLDTRTGVYWSGSQGSMSNSFTAMSLNTCDFFNTTPRGNYGASGTDPDCGLAINACAVLDLGGRTNWYLPSQKELMMAYIDGMYNQAGTTLTNAAAFTTGNYFWSSSERSADSTYAWSVYLYHGYTASNAKTNAYTVRCISRD